MKPTLYVIIPCYNEEKVLPLTAPMFLEQIQNMQREGLVSENSRIMFVNDGSKDSTWEIITKLSGENRIFTGIAQSRNRGHQNAVLAGLMEAKDMCDITISIDCDGQDDIKAMTRMVEEYLSGSEVVYGVRNSRKKDTFFKRSTAQGFYKFMSAMGAEVVYNHADYRLISARVLREFANFKEVNLFLRGMIPLVGFKSSCVYYERHERLAGKSHYPLRKMIALALDGITSLSVKPLRLISAMGFIMSLGSLAGIVWAVVAKLTGAAVDGWASTVAAICLLSSIQLICTGIIGEYIGKIYMEVKGRPRYIISDRTTDPQADKDQT
ncbi:MAG: glycosyltransferase family 2 protein [Ruminococcus sp.]|nr:glycosyltransferase family 2 protein [Ruminococcus sp.]